MACTISTDLAGPAADMARSLLARRYADSRFRQGRLDEALHWAERAARYAEESVDKFSLAGAYEVLNLIYAGSGREEPLPYGRLALQAYTELGDLRHQGWCLNNLAMQDFGAGRWNESLTKFRQATGLFRRIGDTAAEGNAIYNEAEILVRQRRYAEARDLLTDVLRIARAVEDDELVALAQREMARVVGGSGDVDRAVSLVRDAHARFVTLGEPSEVWATDLALVEILQQADRSGEAGEALELLGEPAGPRATYDRLVAHQHLADGRPDEARAVLAVALAAAEEETDRLEQGLILHELAGLTEEQRSSPRSASGRRDPGLHRRRPSRMNEPGRTVAQPIPPRRSPSVSRYRCVSPEPSRLLWT